MCIAMSRESSANFGFRATKSVSLLTSTSTPILPPGVNIAGDEPFVCGPLGFLCSLRGAAFEKQRLSALYVARSVEQRLAAVHHRSAGLLTQRFDLFRLWLIGNQRPASAIVAGASASASSAGAS